MTKVGRNRPQYKKPEDENGHFNTSDGVTRESNINSLPGNFKDPVFSLGRNRLNETLAREKCNPLTGE